MILVEFDTSRETKYLTYGKPVKLDHQWLPGISNFGQLSQAITRNYGGRFVTQPSTIEISPRMFSRSEFPPLGSYSVRVKWVNSGCTTEATAFQFWEGKAYFTRLNKGQGVVFSLHSGGVYDTKIDLDANWASINNNSLVDVITSLCGADYLQLVVDSTYARNASPTVNVTLTGEAVCIELVTGLAEFYGHCFRIDAGVLYLIDMNAEVGDEIVLTSEKIKEGGYESFTPVSEIKVSGEDAWAVVTGSYPGFGQEISLTKYHDTESNALVEMGLIKSITDRNKGIVNVPIDFLPSIPTLGQRVTWTDRRVFYNLSGSILVRNANWDLVGGFVRLSGDADIGLAPIDPAVIVPVSTGAAWSQIIDNGETGYTSLSFTNSSTRMTGVYGTTYQYATAPSGGAGKTATWTFTLPETGTFEIFITWSSYTDRPTDAPYQVLDNTTLIETIDIDQTAAPGGWYSLGVVNFSTTTCVVKLTDDATDGTYITADAVKVEKTNASATLPSSTTYTLVMEETVQSNREQVGDKTDRIWAACAFVATETSTISRIIMSLQANGSPTQNITVEIWTDDGDTPTADAPSTLVSAATTTLDASTLTSSLADYTFDGISASLTSGAKYWIVIKASAVNASNYVWWGIGTSGTTNRLVMGTSAPVWANEGNYTGNFKLYKTA